MIARLWTTGVDEARAAEYEAFARDISLPMFRRQPGFAGALMLRRGAESMVVTLWKDAASIAALDQSQSYADTVRAITGRRVLRGTQRVETFDVHLWAGADGKVATQ